MPLNPPQTLSVKRKRNEAPVNSLVVEGGEKRQKSDTYAWRLVKKPGVRIPPPLPAVQSDRRFHVSYAAGSRILVESRGDGQAATTDLARDGKGAVDVKTVNSEQVAPGDTPRPRKRPGAGTAIHTTRPTATEKAAETTGPSEEEVRHFEQFSQELEKDELVKSQQPPSPLKFMPKVPKLRYKERHPETGNNPDAMDVDDYVFDTYVREIVMPDATGKLPEPQGTVGIIVLNEEDEEWWNGDDESDREFATDDEDENAEDHYANDYPEDELSSDDEYGRNPYQQNYRRGSDTEEFNLNDEPDDVGARSDGDEDDEHFRRIAPTARSTGYWGRIGE